MVLEVVKGFRWLITNPIIPQNAGGGQPAQVEDVVPDQRHEEHDRWKENPTNLQDERQAERGRLWVVRGERRFLSKIYKWSFPWGILVYQICVSMDRV